MELMKRREASFYWHWLNCMPGIGKRKQEFITTRFGKPWEIYELTERMGIEEAKKYLDDVRNCLINEGVISPLTFTQKDISMLTDNDYMERTYKSFMDYKSKGIRMTCIDDEDYPEKLKDIFEPPYIIYYRGQLPKKNMKTVAIVGSRECSDYGRNMAKKLSYELAMNNVMVVSGFARGIDTAAHNGCLMAGGMTTAVFGNGIEVCYPKENIFTYNQILECKGCIMSELEPYIQPQKGQFPLRNRIISGLADVVIVIEAGKRSGSLITIEHALEQNRTVMALPGRATDRLSVGCNELIKQGAGLITSTDDVLFELGIKKNNDNDKISEKTIENGKPNNYLLQNELAKEEKMLYSQLDFNPQHIDELINKSNMKHNDVVSILTRFELLGLVCENGGYYMKV